MSARVAHELRNPISVLGGFIKRLEKNIDVPEARTRYIKIISDEILRLEQIVKRNTGLSVENLARLSSPFQHKQADK